MSTQNLKALLDEFKGYTSADLSVSGFCGIPASEHVDSEKFTNLCREKSLERIADISDNFDPNMVELPKQQDQKEKSYDEAR